MTKQEAEERALVRGRVKNRLTGTTGNLIGLHKDFSLRYYCKVFTGYSYAYGGSTPIYELWGLPETLKESNDKPISRP